MLILATNLTYYTGGSLSRMLTTLVAITGIIILTLSVTYMLMINAKFKFKIKDLCKLGMFYILTDLKATLSIIAIYILVLGTAVGIADFFPLLLASIVCHLLVKYTYGALLDIQQNFTKENTSYQH